MLSTLRQRLAGHTEELRHRDSVVFSTLAKMKIPCGWNLAGGYQVEPDGSIPKVLEIHDNTMSECIKAQQWLDDQKKVANVL